MHTCSLVESNYDGALFAPPGFHTYPDPIAEPMVWIGAPAGYGVVFYFAGVVVVRRCWCGGWPTVGRSVSYRFVIANALAHRYHLRNHNTKDMIMQPVM